MRRVAVLASLALLASAFGTSRARAGDDADDGGARARDAIVAGARGGGGGALDRALTDADALVTGPSPTFPDLGALADFLGTLPPDVRDARAVRVRRGWQYVLARRGRDAIEPLEGALATASGDGVVRSYLGEARRQAGDVAGAVADLVRALSDGASDAHVLPSVRKLVYDLHAAPPAGAAGDLPAYASVAATFTPLRALPEVVRAVAEWLAFDASVAPTEERGARLRAEAVRGAARYLRAPEPTAGPEAVARFALLAAGWRGALAPDAADVPERFDLLAVAVRRGELPESDRHWVPEALVLLAHEAAAKGRYVLAHHLARRRLSISDSPAARRVLLSLPPDVGD